MNPWYLLATLVALASTLLHAIGGEILVVGPLRRQCSEKADATRFAIFDVVWHLVTVQLAAATLGLAYLAWTAPNPPSWRPAWSPFADFLILQFIAVACLFLAVIRRRFGRPLRVLRLPQWTLFVTLAVLTAGGAHLGPIETTWQRFAAAIAMAVLFALGALHVYWAFGGLWPGKDRASLARTVAGVEPHGRFPGAAATLAVALLLFIAVGVVAGASGWWSVPGKVSGLGGLGWLGMILCAIFLLRGLAGFFEIHLRPTIAGSPYARWNVALYSPLCLVLALLVAVGVRHS